MAKEKRARMFQQTPDCGLCGVRMNLDYGKGNRAKATIDHKLPLSRGGRNTQNNLWLVCQLCNSLKGNLTVEEFVELRSKGLIPKRSSLKRWYNEDLAKMKKLNWAQVDEHLSNMKKRQNLEKLLNGDTVLEDVKQVFPGAELWNH